MVTSSDVGLGDTGFHDVVIENLLGTSVWRSRHVTPADIIGLRQRWPKAVFQVMRERQPELEDLRRKAFTSNHRRTVTLGGAIARCVKLNQTKAWILT